MPASIMKLINYYAEPLTYLINHSISHMSKYIIEFMEENELFYKNQFGFRKQHSTSHAIITLIEKVSKALDTGKIVVGVFLDLKKAFDTVDHTILLRKLKLYGIRGKVHDWFSSYLNNRSQFVHYNDYNSEKNTLLMVFLNARFWGLCCSLSI